MSIPDHARRAWRAWIPLALSALTLLAAPAHAVPSYARQTGMECSGCHIGAFGPQLTPAGMLFKLGGYTDTDGKDAKVPLSGMVVSTYTHTKAPQDPPPDGLASNNNLTLDEASLFIAGRFTDHIGSFAQITYDGVAHQVGMDQTDVRYATTTELFGRPAIVGLTVNNTPTTQDPFNTLPAWGYPFLAPAPGFGTGDSASLINLSLGGIVAGASVYTLWDKSWYAELGSYRSLAPQLQDDLGLGRDEQKLEGNAYWRFAWTQDHKDSAWHLGTFGWSARLDPDRTQPNPVDSFRDVGIDGGYEYLGTRENVFGLYGSLTSEQQLSGADGSRSHLIEERLNATYNYLETWGASGGLFDTHGSDPTTTTRGFLLQADWTPWGKESASAPHGFEWANVRMGVQYWHYSEFDGATAGASAQNTASLFLWGAF